MLEQYPTSAHIAASMLYTIHTAFDEISGKVIGMTSDSFPSQLTKFSAKSQPHLQPQAI